MTETVTYTNQLPLRWVRKSQGLTMRELAYFAHCSHSTIQQIENGSLNASPQIKARIAKALRRPVWDLFPPDTFDEDAPETNEASAANADLMKTADAGGGHVPS